MRISNNMVSLQVLENIRRNLDRLTRLQTQLASARRINAPSDDPQGAARAVEIRSDRASTAQFQRNINEAGSNLEATETALQSALDLLTRVREVTVRAADDSQGPLERQGAAELVDQYLEDLLGVGNTLHDNRFLFGGQESLTAPYAATRNAQGQITAVTANPRGIDGQILTEIDTGVQVALNLSGEDAFGTAADPDYAFDILITLRDDLQAGNVAGIRAALADLDSAINRALVSTTVVGSRLSRLSLASSHLDGDDLAQADLLSRIEDADMAEAMMQFQKEETIYQVALAAGARLLQPSLVDFLR